ncbi:MAG: Asp-tRNA(Asn)/Glu-tRNA(Gln) amidotransferase subunit GatC [Planctomycetes bacterium]|nr:Asp-tRNA(Asn)/Glu-tRNA(Gln) amidotransferase subunit GatC [Planctomycetota bacterium]
MEKTLTREEVEKVAVLARLKLSDTELDRFTAQLGKVLEYVAILNEVNTDDVEPMAHAVEMKNVFRDDVPTPSLSREQALANAPKTDGKFFLVPQILEEV